MYPELRVIGDKPGAEKIFALNDLAFAGGERFDRYTLPLDRLLRSWMKGDTSEPVQTAFPFDVPGPSTAPDLVDRLLDAYIHKRDAEREGLPDTGKYNAVFLGSGPVLRLTKKGAELRWRWKLDDCVLRIKAGTAVQAERAAALLKTASEGNGIEACELFKALETNFGSSAKQVWKTLRRQGLALIVPVV
jgi:hypothetical protein